LLHAAIDVGIAGAALDDGADFVRTKSRPWFESGADQASEDPLIIQRIGELAIAVRGAEALLAHAANEIDTAGEDLTAESAGRASIAVATVRAASAKVAVDVASALFEVSGTRSSLDELNLNRHWRNARTHTLHDPAVWKVQHVGRYTLNGTLPPRHGLL
jgi:alkylation response protein AidB-like acyl-CoA dehydrogenase